MATIKDVAKLAGVSHGTVSNVLSGKAAVSLDKVRRVNEAMDALGYHPDIQARALKTSTSRQVAVILPNVEDPHFASIFSTIERVIGAQGLVPSLFITSDVPVRERSVVSKILGRRMAGLILMTCQPEDADFLRRTSEALPTVFIERPVVLENTNFIGSDFGNQFSEILRPELDAGMSVGLITGPMNFGNESSAAEAFRDSCADTASGYCSGIHQESGMDKQAGFQAAVRLLNDSDSVQVIFTTSELIAEGVEAAINLLHRDTSSAPDVRSFVSDSWSKGLGSRNTVLLKPSRQIGESAAELLLNWISHPKFAESRRIICPFSTRNPSSLPAARTDSRKTIRVLLMEGESADSVKQLLGNLVRETGIPVDIETCHFSGLHDTIIDRSISDDFDVMQVDIPWIPEFVHQQRLMDLSGFVNRYPGVLEHYPPGVIEQYSRHQEKIYGIPFQFGTQLLFYRKDLFDSQNLKHFFHEWYQSELRPPRNWTEFNAVARFFTRSLNPDSPVPYGTTLGAGNPSGAVCEFLPRQWSMDGKTFGESGEITIDAWESVKALDSYVECFEYAQQNAADHWWDDQLDVFCRGDSAMMVMFALHATPISDRSRSSVVGQVGFDRVPGGKSLLGGYSLGINANSHRSEDAFAFIRWITGAPMAVPFTILGGLTPSLSLYNSSELLTMYPWLPEAHHSFEISTKRVLPENAIRRGMSEADFEQILGKSIAQAVKGNLSSQESLTSARVQLESRLSRSKGENHV